MIMLKTSYQTELSPYSDLYDLLISEDHTLRRFNDLVDFSFIYEELENEYCLVDGRNACNPIMLFKYLILKALHPESDKDLVNHSKTDMAYKYFLGLNPEDDVIDPSLLSKFRRLRLKDPELLDKLLEKSIQIANEKGVAKSKTIIVDATHSAARFNKKTATETLSLHAKNVRKTIYNAYPDAKSSVPQKNQKKDYQAEKEYCEHLIETVSQHPEWTLLPSVSSALNYLEEFIEDCREHEIYSKDTSAKVGHKTKDSEFFGYKTHLAMTEDRLISAAIVTSGDKGDGQFLQELVKRSRKNGVTVEEIIGDTAYSGKDNLAFAQKEELTLYSKLHPIISEGTRKPEDEWNFNKDAGMFVCPQGHMAIRKAVQGKKNRGQNQRLTFYFDINHCHDCPVKDGCYKEGAKSKSYSITIKSNLHHAQEEFQNTEEFKERYGERYMIEGKNSEIKNRHGYDVAWSDNIEGMRLQGAVTLFTTNMKRIMKLEDNKRKKSE